MTLYEKLPKGKQNLIERYQFSPRYLSIKHLLKSRLFVIDLTIGEADDVFQLFYHDIFDLNKLYKLFK